MEKYKVNCDCGAVEVSMNGAPLGAGYCHCEDCRTLLNVPYHSLAVWNPNDVQISVGDSATTEFKHPHLRMTRVYCNYCGESMYNTNSQGMKLVSQLLIRKNYNGDVPYELHPQMHFFYGRRIVDVNDNLPKYG